MMGKKEFTQIAKTLYDKKASDKEIDTMADVLEKQNPRFDRERFRIASKEAKLTRTPKKYWQ